VAFRDIVGDIEQFRGSVRRPQQLVSAVQDRGLPLQTPMQTTAGWLVAAVQVGKHVDAIVRSNQAAHPLSIRRVFMCHWLSKRQRLTARRGTERW
jgi:hypothetical protein